jgi:hypothetical protein
LDIPVAANAIQSQKKDTPIGILLKGDNTVGWILKGKTMFHVKHCSRRTDSVPEYLEF